MPKLLLRIPAPPQFVPMIYPNSRVRSRAVLPGDVSCNFRSLALPSRAAVATPSFSASIFTGRPPRRPRLAAAARSACTRSWISDRSNWAICETPHNSHYAARLDVGDRGQPMRQQAAKPVQLPDHQSVACPEKRKNLGRSGIDQTLTCPAIGRGLVVLEARFTNIEISSPVSYQLNP